MLSALLLLTLACSTGPIYYPEVGTNGWIWRPGQGLTGGPAQDSGDTDTDAETSADTDTGARLETEVIPMKPGDSPPCATGRSDAHTAITFRNLRDDAPTISEVDDDCSESLIIRVHGEVVLSPGVGQALVVRAEADAAPLYAVLVGHDTVTLELR